MMDRIRSVLFLLLKLGKIRAKFVCNVKRHTVSEVNKVFNHRRTHYQKYFRSSEALYPWGMGYFVVSFSQLI